MLSEDQSEKWKTTEKSEEPIVEELDFEKADYRFIPPGNHEWRQQGQFLVCKSCELEHAFGIGPDKLLVGFDQENKPIIKSRSDVEG
jgi:hypothetical protein